MGLQELLVILLIAGLAGFFFRRLAGFVLRVAVHAVLP